MSRRSNEKQLVRGQLQTIKNNYAIAQAGIALLIQPGARAKMYQIFSGFQDHPEMQIIQYVDYVFENDELLGLATRQFRNAVLRNCLKELFEVTKLYAQESGQTSVIQAAPWYQFLRMVRNSLSHDMTLRFGKADLRRLPVRWSDLTIDISMEGQELPMDGFLTRIKSLELIDAVIQYVDDKCE